MNRPAIYLIVFIICFSISADLIRNEVSFHNFMQNKTNYDYVKEYQPEGYDHYLNFDKDMKRLMIVFYGSWICIYIGCAIILTEKIKDKYEKEKDKLQES